jgi:hypothetical protein
MNCIDFEKIVTELADYQPMLSTTRNAGVSHAAWCADCARKLADVRAVSGSLLLAAGAEIETMPADVKAKLMAAFREQSLRASNVVEIAATRKLRWPVAAGFAAAVAAVIVLAVMLPLWKQTSQPAVPTNNVVAKGSEPVAASPQKLVTGSTHVSENRPLAITSRGNKPQLSKRRVEGVAGRRAGEVAAVKTSDEFVPLTYLAKTTAMDTGTIIRVRLSRSALVSLGLPVNPENSSDSVSAEVIIGDDGVARAIRLVQ